MHIGNAIKDLRKQRGFKQNEFAELCELSQSYLSLIENGTKEPTLSMLKKIASQLEVPMPVLVFYSLDSDDVSDTKKEAFRILEPTLKSLINQAFISSPAL